MLSFKPAFSLSSFTLIKRLFSSSLLSTIKMVSSAYPKLLIFLPAVLIPAYDSSSPAFRMMCSAEYTEELYKKDLHDLHNHDGVITHLEPDILECKVKWALRSITINKAKGMMEFQLSYFKSWKTMLEKCCQHFWKTQQWPQDRKRSTFIPIPKKDDAKEWSNYSTITR